MIYKTEYLDSKYFKNFIPLIKKVVEALKKKVFWSLMSLGAINALLKCTLYNLNRWTAAPGSPISAALGPSLIW